MAHFLGTVSKNDLEGGFWQLVADDGTRYQLKGGDDSLRVEGQEVEIDGAIDEQAFGLAMSGPTLQVRSWKKR